MSGEIAFTFDKVSGVHFHPSWSLRAVLQIACRNSRVLLQLPTHVLGKGIDPLLPRAATVLVILLSTNRVCSVLLKGPKRRPTSRIMKIEALSRAPRKELLEYTGDDRGIHLACLQEEMPGLYAYSKMATAA